MEPTLIKYPPDVASEFFIREKQNPLTLEQYVITGQAFNDLNPRVDYPAEPVLTQLVETMLFASMATEEGHLTQVGIVFAQSMEPFQNKQSAWNLLRFASSLSFDVRQITKLASACGSLDSLLAVIPDGKKLAVVGIASPHSHRWFDSDLLVRVVILKPGVISVRRGEQELVRYNHGAIPSQPPSLERGDGQFRPQLDSVERTLFKEEYKHLKIDVGHFLRRIVETMVRLEHGGLLAVLGPDDEPSSLLNEAKRLAEPLRFGVALREMYHAQLIDEQNSQNRYSVKLDNFRPPTEQEETDAAIAQEETQRVDRLIVQIARLTTVDGAVLMTHSLDVLAFGVKLPSTGGVPTVLSVTPDRRIGEPWPLDKRGTRHRAAAVFAERYAQGLAFIVSQDGEAAIFQQLEEKVVHWPLSV